MGISQNCLEWKFEDNGKEICLFYPTKQPKFGIKSTKNSILQRSILNREIDQWDIFIPSESKLPDPS